MRPRPPPPRAPRASPRASAPSAASCVLGALVAPPGVGHRPPARLRLGLPLRTPGRASAVRRAAPSPAPRWDRSLAARAARPRPRSRRRQCRAVHAGSSARPPPPASLWARRGARTLIPRVPARPAASAASGPRRAPARPRRPTGPRPRRAGAPAVLYIIVESASARFRDVVPGPEVFPVFTRSVVIPGVSCLVTFLPVRVLLSIDRIVGSAPPFPPPPPLPSPVEEDQRRHPRRQRARRQRPPRARGPVRPVRPRRRRQRGRGVHGRRRVRRLARWR